MQRSVCGFANPKLLALFILSGMMLLLGASGALLSAHRARGEAQMYLGFVAPLRIGTAYETSVAELRQAGIVMTAPRTCERQCTVSFYCGNTWQQALHLTPRIELVGQLEFQDGRLAHKLTAMRQGIYVADVAESASTVSHTSTSPDSLGRLRSISVELSALDFTPYRRLAYAFNLGCVGSLRGCRTDEFLQTTVELEHKTPSSVPVHDLALKGRTVDVISRLAMKYHIVAGLYGVSIDGDHEPMIDVLIKDGTLGDAFDAIIKADPRLGWHQSDSAVHFVSRNFPIALMDVTVHSFDADDDLLSGILDRLDNTPEIHAWLLDNRCHTNRRADAEMAENDITPRYISVHVRDLTYSSILDQIATKSRAYFWCAVRSTSSPCALYTTWRE